MHSERGMKVGCEEEIQSPLVVRSEKTLLVLRRSSIDLHELIDLQREMNKRSFFTCDILCEIMFV
jgi:hypothetical protein